VGSVPLGNIEASVARVENTVDDFPAGNRHRLATSRIADVLAMEVSVSEWSARKESGADSTHPPDVGRQSDLE